MAMEGFELLLARIVRRARLLRGLEGVPLPLAAGLALVLSFRLVGVLDLGLGLSLGPGPWDLPFYFYWAIPAALLFALGGFLWGYSRRVDPARVLFLVDRRMELHERLSSFYELYRGRGREEFLLILAPRLPEPEGVNLAAALPWRWRRRWLLPLALVLCLLLSGLPHRLPLLPFPGIKRGMSGSGVEFLERLEALEQELGMLWEGLTLLEWEGPMEGRAEWALALRTRLEEEFWGRAVEPSLRREIAEELARLGGPPASEVEPRGGMVVGGPEPGVEVEAPEAELQARARAELERLAERLKGGALKEFLQVLSHPEAQARAGFEVMRGVETAQALIRGLAEAGERLEKYEREQLAGQPQLGRPEGRTGEESLSKAQAQGEGRGGGEEGKAGKGGEGGQPSEGARPGSVGEEAMAGGGLGRKGRLLPGEEPLAAGEEAGALPGGPPLGEAEPTMAILDLPIEPRVLHLAGEVGELGEVEWLIARGTPFEASGPEPEDQPQARARARLTLTLSLPRMAAILEGRGLPPELKEVVKRYFLIITEEG